MAGMALRRWGKHSGLRGLQGNRATGEVARRTGMASEANTLPLSRGQQEWKDFLSVCSILRTLGPVNETTTSVGNQEGFYHSEEADLRRGRKSQYGVALQFHRKVMFEWSAHLHRLEQLAQKHNVSEKWLEDYRKAILEALLREAAVCYPKLRDPVEGRKPALQIRPHSFAVDGQGQLYEAIATAFAKRKKITSWHTSLRHCCVLPRSTYALGS
jgi:hypothetical protein